MFPRKFTNPANSAKNQTVCKIFCKFTCFIRHLTHSVLAFSACVRYDEKNGRRDMLMAQYYMLHKPRGLLTAKRDARRETVMSCFPEALRETLHPVGRLDRDTEGLLLFTDDGMLDVRLLRPEQHVEKGIRIPRIRASARRCHAAAGDGRFAPSRGSRLPLPARAQLLAHTNMGKARRICRSASAKKYLKTRPGLSRSEDSGSRKAASTLKRLCDRSCPAGRNAPPRRIPAPIAEELTPPLCHRRPTAAVGM